MRTSTTLLAGALLFGTSLASADEPARPRYRNNAMRISGIVITSLATAMAVASIPVMASSGGNCGETGCPNLWAGLFGVLPGSAVLAAVGVPLWVVGARSPSDAAPSAAAMPLWIPSVAASPRSASLRWSF